MTIGCVWGALRQPAAFDSTVDTISALAALGAPDRWIMTLSLVLLGACHVITGLGLRGGGRLGRVALIAGGLATVLVAVFPLPHQGGSLAHFVAATATFALLAVWPLCALRLGDDAPRSFRPPIAIGSTVLLSLSIGWLMWTLSHAPHRIGLVERVAAFAEALWPLVVVLLTRAEQRTRRPLAPTVTGTGSSPSL